MSTVKKLKRRLSLTLRRSRSGIMLDESISELTEQININDKPQENGGRLSSKNTIKEKEQRVNVINEKNLQFVHTLNQHRDHTNDRPILLPLTNGNKAAYASQNLAFSNNEKSLSTVTHQTTTDNEQKHKSANKSRAKPTYKIVNQNITMFKTLHTQSLPQIEITDLSASPKGRTFSTPGDFLSFTAKQDSDSSIEENPPAKDIPEVKLRNKTKLKKQYSFKAMWRKSFGNGYSLGIVGTWHHE